MHDLKCHPFFCPMKIIFSFIFVLCLNLLHSQKDTTISSNLQSQSEFTNGFINFVGIGFGGILPQSQFGKYVASKFQINASYHRQIFLNKPFFAGIEFSYSQLSSYSSEVTYTSNSSSSIWSVTTTSDLKTFDLIGRHYLPIRFSRVDPFLEFDLGCQWFGTKTNFSPPNSEDPSESEYDKNDLVLRYGLLGGLHINIKDDYFLQIRLGYLSGLSANYFIKKNEIPTKIEESTIEAFDLKSTSTPILKWDIGFSYSF